MPKTDATMQEADTEESWEVLSRTNSDSSGDSRTPVALHFPVDLIPRAASEALAFPTVSKQTTPSPRRMSLDDRILAGRRKLAAGRQRAMNPSIAKAGGPEAGSTHMEVESDSDDSSSLDSSSCGPTTGTTAGAGVTSIAPGGGDLGPGEVELLGTPQQPFFGVLAGESWYSVPVTTESTNAAEGVAEQDSQQTPLTIVFTGAIGSGKSASCNTVLDVETFTARHAAGPVTKDTATAELTIEGGRRVTIVDTPGLGQEGAREAVLEALRDAAVGGGAVALVLVISVAAPYVAGQAAAVAALIESAGQAVLSHTLLLFTHGDALEADRAFLPNYLDEAPPALQELLACVDGRTVMVDNTAKGKGRQDSVEALLSLAASAAVLDASASWLPPTAEHQDVREGREQAADGHENLAVHRGPSDVSRLRKAVVYSIAACGMVGLRVLTSGGGAFARGGGGGGGNGPISISGRVSTPLLWGPQSWRLEDDDGAIDRLVSAEDTPAARTSNLDADCGAFVEVAAIALL
mmetsp:Transcript_8607/g.25836  ORF Transcript_8607/g.25836 Transcript_8607/m.25836 type:complete len:521 (-) Transcript_8607:672-2234(-)